MGKSKICSAALRSVEKQLSMLFGSRNANYFHVVDLILLLCYRDVTVSKLNLTTEGCEKLYAWEAEQEQEVMCSGTELCKHHISVCNVKHYGVVLLLHWQEDKSACQRGAKAPKFYY